MKNSKLLFLGTLVVLLAAPAMAGIPTIPFTGNVEDDFDPVTHPGILVIEDPGGQERDRRTGVRRRRVVDGPVLLSSTPDDNRESSLRRREWTKKSSGESC